MSHTRDGLSEDDVARWLMGATARATGAEIVIDPEAESPCVVNPHLRVICLRSDLGIDGLLHVLPRASLVAVFGDHVVLDGVGPPPLRLVGR